MNSQESLSGKCLLITGGTGSFGNAVLDKFLNSDLNEIRIFSRDEKKQEDLRLRLNNHKVKFYIGDVRDLRSVESAVAGVDYVFHAAALKQVPSCEFFPIEAVRTNVLGADNVMEASIKQAVKKVVILSTDKAVYPINAMGQSKALMEKVMIARSRNVSSPVLSGTRYGNVMASRGSVIPLFVDQILQGKPITVTDPGMTRFMMNLDGAVDLVMYAFSNAQPGDIFIQKAPAATIETLVMALKDIFKASNPVITIGTRHGEKLYETLVNREEMAKAEDLGPYFRIPADTRELNYEQYFSIGKEEVSDFDEYHSHNTRRLDLEETRCMLFELDYVKNALKNYNR
jgi:UDP-N-acetylglucosamine 4,6-dehydratase/5-epimerase